MFVIGDLFFLIGAIVLLIYWVFNFIVLYHLTRFGIGTLPKKIALVFLLGNISLFFLSVIFYANSSTTGVARILSSATTGISLVPTFR